MNVGVVRGLTIIVPLLNEEAGVPTLIKQLSTLDAEQIIVVDGGSTDDTCRLMRAAGFRVLESTSGRSRQMNIGAKEASQEMLLFLHADTQLPKSYKLEVNKAEIWGRFDVEFYGSSNAMNIIAFFINLRSRITGVATGDQALFVDRSVFESLGGFPDIPLMEDIALCKRLRLLHRPFNSKAKVITSARRWEKNGVIATVLKMWWYRLAYFFGLSLFKLKKGYDDVR